MGKNTDLLDNSSVRDCLLKCYVNSKESEKIKVAARQSGNLSVSNYIRKCLFFAGNMRFPIEFDLGDLRAMMALLSEYNQRMQNIINAFQYRTELYRTDLENLIQISKELNCMVQDVYRKTLSDRKVEKKKAERHLREEVDKRLSLIWAEEQSCNPTPGKRYK